MSNLMQCVMKVFFCGVVCVSGLSASMALAVDNIDPGDTGAQFAWGENTGWLNAEPGGDGGPMAFV